MIGRTLYRYIAWRIIKSIAVAFVVVTGIIALVDFVEGSRNLGADADITPIQLLGLTLLKVPSLIEQTIPFVVLFGVMGALYGMNRRSELIVMRASGLSAWRFLRPAISVAGVLGLAWATVFNPLASNLFGQYEAREIQLLEGENAVAETSVWLRAGTDTSQMVIHAPEINLAQRRLINPSFYLMDIESDGGIRFARRYDAAEALLVTNGFWQLTDVVENTPGQTTQILETVSLPTTLTAEDIRNQSGQQSPPPFWAIPGKIEEARRAGFSARSLQMRLNKLLALPVLLIAMTCIAAGVSMSLTREGGTLRLMITGAVLGFAVFFADSVISAFGEVALLPVILAAWTVPILVLLLAITHLARIEDG